MSEEPFILSFDVSEQRIILRQWIFQDLKQSNILSGGKELELESKTRCDFYLFLYLSFFSLLNGPTRPTF